MSQDAAFWQDKVGQELQNLSGTVCAKEFQRWATAVGENNPLYFDAGFARAHGHPDVVMPPMFVSQVVNGVDRKADLREDGSTAGGWFGPIDVPGDRRMVGGSDYSFFASAYPGDTISCAIILDHIEEKQGRSGKFTLIRWDRRYRNQRDEMVARSIDLVIAR